MPDFGLKRTGRRFLNFSRQAGRFLPSLKFWLKNWWGKPLAVFVLAVGLVGFLSLAGPAHAADWEEYVYGALAKILEAVAGLIASLLLWVIHYIIVLSGYNNFLNARVVAVGWSLTRDIANMFYILVMLLIAFGTMFKVEQYSWKKLLPRLILTAVFVNFSKTIIGLFIDFAQVIMLTFVNGYAAVAGGNFVQMFGLDKMFKISAETTWLGTSAISFAALTGFLLGTVLLGVALIVTAVFAAILLFRIITLWVLIVLAPIAFLLGTFPKGQEYYSDWWKRLTNQIIVGPMIAFFLWLTLAAVGGVGQYEQLTENNAISTEIISAKESTGKPIGTGELTDIAKWENLGSFAVVIAMLFVALQFTQQLGVAGAGLASGAAGWMKQQGVNWAKRAAVPAALGVATGGLVPGLAWFGAGKGAIWGGKELATGAWSRTKKELNERLPAWANVPARFAAWKERTKEKEEYARSVAAARQKRRYYKNVHGVDLPFEEQLEEAKANEMYKMFSGLTQEEQVARAQELYTAGDSIEARRLRMLVYRIMQRSGYVDDASAAMPQVLSKKAKGAPRGARAEREWSLKFLLGDDYEGLNDEAKKKRERERQPELRLMAGKQGFDCTHPEYSYIADADEAHPGQLRVLSYEKQVEKTRTEVRKGGSERPKVTSPHYEFDLDEKGKVLGFRDNDSTFFKDVNSDIAENDLGRNAPQKRVLEAIRSGQVGAEMKDGYYEFDESHLGLIKQMTDENPFLVKKAFSTPGLKGVKVRQSDGSIKKFDNIAKATMDKRLEFTEQEQRKIQSGEGQEEQEEIPPRLDMKQELPDALVQDGVVSSGEASANPAAVNQLVGHLESDTEKVGADINFSELVEALRRNETALKNFASQMSKGDKSREEKIVNNLKTQMGINDSAISKLIYNLWWNTRALKEKKAEDKEKKKKEMSTETPPSPPPPPPAPPKQP